MKRAQTDRIDAALGVLGWIAAAAVTAGSVAYARAFRSTILESRRRSTNRR